MSGSTSSSSAAPIDPNVLARQRKKIEKDRRRKHYDDLQVQGTNSSSIVSKSSVEMIYSPKLTPELTCWFQFFVPKPKRRSPAINRGYWIRMESIKRLVMNVIDSEVNRGKEINVINLGCGFDPLPFQLLEIYQQQHSEKWLNFIDIDYPELVKTKLSMIQQAPPILSIVGDELPGQASLGSLFQTQNYKLLGCDLKNRELYKQQLHHYCQGANTVNIFIAEVSLAYMKPEDANPIIEISSQTVNSHFIILEQILPVDKYHSFASKMLYHFQHLRSPLQCVEHYPQRTHQHERFTQWFPHAEIHDLLQNWQTLISDDTKQTIATIEAFDEWEEFIVFCQHYTIVHATNQSELTSLYPSSTAVQPTQLSDKFSSIQLEVIKDNNNQTPQLELKFPAVASRQNEVIIHGGLSQTRSDEVWQFDPKSQQLGKLTTTGPKPSARMGHSLTSINGGQEILLIGGRGRPQQYSSEVFKLTRDNEWRQLQSMATGRARHSTVSCFGGRYVLVFGGDVSSGPAFALYDVGADQWRELEMNQVMPNLASSAMVVLSENISENRFEVLIWGGMADTIQPTVNSQLFKVSVDVTSLQADVGVVCEHECLARIGSQGLVKDRSSIVIVGGVDRHEPFGADDTVVEFNMDTQQVTPVKINPETWQHFAPTMIGFGMACLPESEQPHARRRAVIIGGGAVCYSFGSSYNAVYSIEY